MDMPRNCWNGHGQSSTAACGPPPATRPAATVVLLRDGPDGIEVALLQKSAHLGFARGMYVFLAERWMRPTPPVGIRG